MNISENYSQKFLNILAKLKIATDQIMDIEDQKYGIIKNMEMDLLLSCNEKEAFVLSQIEGIEKERMKLIEVMAQEMNFDPMVPIRDLLVYFPEEQAKVILNMSLEIKHVCTQINIYTERNEYILNSNLEIIGQVLELVHGVSIGQYNNKGLTADLKKQSLYMLDQLV